MLALASTSLLSPWVAMPPAILAILLIAGHLLALQVAEMPERRRRIRTAAGLLFMVVTALLAYALGVMDALRSPVADLAASREYVIVWFSIVCLLFMIISLAAVDLAVTTREAALERAVLRRELRERLRISLESRRSAAASHAGEPDANR